MRRNAFSLVFVLVGMGCGGASDQASDGELASVQQAETSIPAIPKDLKNFADYAGAIGSVYDGAKAVGEILQLLNIIPAPTSMETILYNIEQDLEKAIDAVTWQAAEIALSQRRSRAITAAEAARGIVANGGRVERFDDLDRDSRSAVLEQLDDIAYRRGYATLPNRIGQQFEIPADPPRTADGEGLVYDWRLGVLGLMELIALRLEVITAINPDWRHTPDATMLDEMVQYRDTLLKHYRAMVRGVRCETAVCTTGDFPGPNYVACEDIYSGVSRWWQNSTCPPPLDLNSLKESYQTQLYEEMPLFRMRQMIDALYMYAHPGLRDLTEVAQRIPAGHVWPTANPLCIDVQGGNGAPWTPVWLYPCTGNFAQNWVYDRSRGIIRNPILDKCMSGVALVGSGVTIQECATRTDTEFLWTYDAESQMLLSGLSPLWALNSGPESQTASLLQMYWNSGEGVTMDEEWHADQ